MATQWKTVKVPEWAYDNARTLQRHLAASGTDSLPPRLRRLLRGNNIPGLGELFGLGVAELQHRRRRPR